MAARIVALAVEAHPAEREARRVLAETLAARGLAGDALEGLVGGYISAMRRHCEAEHADPARRWC